MNSLSLPSKAIENKVSSLIAPLAHQFPAPSTLVFRLSPMPRYPAAWFDITKNN
jgi:hypothetical protein